MTTETTRVEETILSISHQIYDGIRRRDAEFLRQFLADDFVQRGADGTEATKDQFLNAISDMPFELGSVSGEYERVSVYGNIAVMTGVQLAEWRQTETECGLNRAAFADVFELRDGNWLLVLAFGADLES